MLTSQRITKSIRQQIEDSLDTCGLFYRVFSREKSRQSLEKKIIQKQYEFGGKLLQDAIGIRIAFYFYDDVKLFMSSLKKMFTLAPNGESIDTPDIDKFSATRLNLVFHIPEEHIAEFKNTYRNMPIDTTFEVQIRTILSEGWHEVDHDLRYKRKTIWDEHKDLSRILNGIMGNLESCDWSMLKIFSDLSYRCYKNKNWNDMIRNKFRLRFIEGDLIPQISEFLNSDSDYAKALLRTDRDEFIQTLLRSKINFPKTVTNLVYYLNFIQLHSPKITAITPPFMLDQWNIST